MEEKATVVIRKEAGIITAPNVVSVGRFTKNLATQFNE